MRISIVVAYDKNRVIGKDGELPWRMSGDLRRFKKLTMGHPMIMGRKTLDSIGRLLPGRTTIVLTRDENYEFPGAQVVHDWDAAVAAARKRCELSEGVDEVFVVGGAQIYELALPHADRVYLTEVDTTVEDGDAFFPPLSATVWQLVREAVFAPGPADQYACSYKVLRKR